MVSMSGQMYNPWSHILSAIFGITIKSSTVFDNPLAIFTDPVPPAISVIKIWEQSCRLFSFFKFC